MPTTQLSRQEQIKRIIDIFIPLMWIAGRKLSQKLQSFNLTHPQFVALATLAVHKQPCAMHDLTVVTFQDPPTMTGIVDRLVAMKLVQRTRNETDRRVVWVQATPAGIELVNQIKEKKLHDDAAGYEALTDDDLAALEQLLGYILRMLMSHDIALQGTDLEAEIKKLQLFMSDPIAYVKSESK